MFRAKSFAEAEYFCRISLTAERRYLFRSNNASVLYWKLSRWPWTPLREGCKFVSLDLLGRKERSFFLETFRFLSHFPYCLLLACPPCNCSTCRVTLVIRKPISDDSSGSECHHHRSSFSNSLTHSPPSSLFLPFTLLSDAKFRVWSNSPNLLRIL